MELEYIVVLNRGVDVEQFHEEMKAETGAGVIPNRGVTVADDRPLSTRQYHYMLTPAEVDWLRKDDRVYGVDLKDNPLVQSIPHGTRDYNFEKIPNVSSLNANWGLARCNKRDNPFDGAGGLSDSDNSYNYVIDGTGIDVVVMDTGVLVDHPEFLDDQGVSRIQQIDWPSAAGAVGVTQPANFYEDSYGHGTHVAGIIGGKTYGWAPGVHIYPMTINLAGITNGFPIPTAFDLIKGWHLNKTNGRPTIVNMSWGQTVRLSSSDWRLFGVLHRNSVYYWKVDYTSRSAMFADLGLLDVAPYVTPENGLTTNDIYGPIRSAATDAAVQELNDVGILTVTSAGNLPVKADVDGGADYDNFASIRYIGVTNELYTNDNLYTYSYHKGSSPYDEKTLSVANLSDSLAVTNQKELIASSSTRGPSIKVIAPGTNIISSWGSNTTYEGANPDEIIEYPFDQDYKIGMISGTSMAAPQVVGVAALYWGLDKKMSRDELITKIELESTKNVVYNTSLDQDYSNNNTLLSTPNRLLYNKFGAAIAGSFENLGSTNFE